MSSTHRVRAHPKKRPSGARPAPPEASRQIGRKAYVPPADLESGEYQPGQPAFLNQVRESKALTVHEESAANYLTLGELRGYARDDLFVIAEIAYHYLFNGNPEVALTLFEGLQAVLPNEPYFSLALGLTYDHLGDPALSIQWYHAASKLDPADGRPDINCAEICIERGQLDTARRYLQRGGHKAQRRGDKELMHKSSALLSHIDRQRSARKAPRRRA